MGDAPVLAVEAPTAGTGWPGWPGAGAPKVVCAIRCSGPGSAPATAVPQRATTTVAMIPAARTGALRAPGAVLGLACVPDAAATRTNAATAAASPDSSRSVPGRAAASNVRARACWAGD